MREDADLLRRYVEFHSDADFTELVGRYLGLVYQAALRRTHGRADLAEDITQYVFTILAAKAAGLIEHKVLAGWLYTTTKHAANSLLRAERRRQAREQEAHMIGNSSADELRPEWEEIRRELDGVMDQLPERDREAVLLRFFHGQAFAQIGTAFGLTEEAARKRVDRALDRLREHLLKRGITSTTSALGLMLSGHAALAAPAGLTQSIASAALAHAAAGASLPAIGALQIMSTKTTLSIIGALGIAGLIGLPAIGIAVYQTRAAHQAEASLSLEQTEYEHHAAEVSQLQRKANDVDQRVAKLQSQLDQARAAEAEAKSKPTALPITAPANSGSSAEAKMRSDGDSFIATFSQAREALMEIGQAQIHAGRTGFYQAAGLSAAQIEEYERRTAAYMLNFVALTPTSIRPVVNELPPEQLRQLLGEDGFQRLQDFHRAEGAYGVTGQIGMAVGLVAPPLSPDQSTQITQAIIANSSSFQKGGKLDPSTVDWSAVLTQAQQSLTPAQFQATQPVFLSMQFQQAVSRAEKASSSRAPKS